jgi:hypothetical protein
MSEWIHEWNECMNERMIELINEWMESILEKMKIIKKCSFGKPASEMF